MFAVAMWTVPSDLSDPSELSEPSRPVLLSRPVMLSDCPARPAVS